MTLLRILPSTYQVLFSPPGYGNNAVEMETTAIYDKARKEFVVNTPTPLAQKYWITNGAVHAKHIVVFAKLIVDGKNEGIHGVLVRIRDNNLKVNQEF